MPSPDVLRYRWSRAYGLLAFGALMVVGSAVWLVAALTSFPGWSLILLLVLAVAVLAALVFLTIRPPVLLEVSTSGYRVRHVKGGGVSAAAWSEVETVDGGTGADGSVLSIRLADGRGTLVPLALLGADAAAAEREVHDRLNAAFGYRRLGGE